MTPRLRTALLAAAAAAAVVATPAPAGVPLVDSGGTPYLWDLDTPNQPNVDNAASAVTYFVGASSLTDTIQGPKSAGNAVRDGVKAWEVGTSRIRFREDASRPASGRNGTDRVNWIGWSASELGGATFAATFPTRVGSQVLDMDVVLNDRAFSWDTFTPGLLGEADIQALVTHEWGHAIGCDHVPLRASTMYYSAESGQISLRSIEPDDVAMVGSLYPSTTFQDSTASVAGKVAVAGTSDDRAVHVVAVSVATAEPAASTLSSPDGSFEIRGLPRGAYRLIAAPCVPLGMVMNSFWRTGSTSFLPGVLADDAQSPPRVRTIRLDVPGTLQAGTIDVGPATAPFEPNDTAVQARQIRLGDAVCAAFENGGDVDWYQFDAAAGDRITVSALAWELGSGADPALALTNAAGTTLRMSLDIRDGSYASQIEGRDRDARILAYLAPTAGTYRVRVTQDNPVTGSQGFYVLFVTAASDAPSALLTTATATPSRIDADGVSRSTVVVRPRREDGEDLGAGATVTLLHAGAGSVGPVADRGDGTYAAEVTAPTSPGRESFGVMVSGAAGLATVQDAATIVYVGPADAARSSLRADPRRVAPGEASTVRFTPRDADGEALGAGRAVSVSLDPTLGATPLGVHDAGDGSYEAPFVAGAITGTATVTAQVDAQPTAVTAPFAVGFALADVLAMAEDDVARFRATPGISKKAARSFATAAKRVASARAVADLPPKEKTALSRTRTALSVLRSGFKRAPAVEDPGTLREMALAVREAAAAAADRVVPRNGREQAKVERARTLLAKGDGQIDGGNVVGAAATWLKAYNGVAKLAARAN